MQNEALVRFIRRRDLCPDFALYDVNAEHLRDPATRAVLDLAIVELPKQAIGSPFNPLMCPFQRHIILPNVPFKSIAPGVDAPARQVGPPTLAIANCGLCKD
jgi:hypothetical protein